MLDSVISRTSKKTFPKRTNIQRKKIDKIYHFLDISVLKGHSRLRLLGMRNLCVQNLVQPHSMVQYLSPYWKLAGTKFFGWNVASLLHVVGQQFQEMVELNRSSFHSVHISKETTSFVFEIYCYHQQTDPHQDGEERWEYCLCWHCTISYTRPGNVSRIS